MFADRIVTNITLKSNLKINIEGRVPLHDGDYFNSSDVVVMLSHEFTEVQYTIKYFGFADILGKIGGIIASLKPILEIIAPWLIILYLTTLADII